MTCEEFYSKIQESNYTQAISQADLITISIGSNELLHIGINAVASVTGVSASDSQFESKAKQAFADASVLQKAAMLKGIYDYFTSETSKQDIETAISKYEEYWVKSVKYIMEENEDVTIVATQFYNPYYNISLATYDLGSFVDQYIQRMNTILENRSDSENKYKIAKIYSAFNTTNPRITNVNISASELSIDPHPNKAGHEIIYGKILDALSTQEESIEDKKDITKVTISSIPDQVYTGEEIEPDIIIKDGDKELFEDKDFIVAYSNNIEIGIATVTITGIEEYEGTVEKTFNITSDGKTKSIENVTIENIEKQTYTGTRNNTRT